VLSSSSAGLSVSTTANPPSASSRPTNWWNVEPAGGCHFENSSKARSTAFSLSFAGAAEPARPRHDAFHSFLLAVG
jgi:hypothetical protein